MFARYDRMAKQFTRYGKEIVIAVKQSGPDPEANPRLRTAIQNAKAINMPKDRIDSAIRRASNKDEKDMEEVVYEGYAPHGVAILCECATDNPTRTVANIRSYFNRGGGALGKTGSLDFIFERKGVFTISTQGLDIEELELDLIDNGLQELEIEEGEAVIITSFEDFVGMQKFLEQRKITVTNGELQRIANTSVALSGEAAEEVLKLVEKMEEDDDIQAVYHNMKME